VVAICWSLTESRKDPMMSTWSLGRIQPPTLILAPLRSTVSARPFFRTMLERRSEALDVSNWLHSSGSPAWTGTSSLWPITKVELSGLTTELVTNCSGMGRWLTIS
jgi:hypothetical protein